MLVWLEEYVRAVVLLTFDQVRLYSFDIKWLWLPCFLDMLLTLKPVEGRVLALLIAFDLWWFVRVGSRYPRLIECSLGARSASRSH